MESQKAAQEQTAATASDEQWDKFVQSSIDNMLRIFPDSGGWQSQVSEKKERNDEEIA
jgi:hypothetical protein